MTEDIDLCVNCYERTYRRVLAPGFPGRISPDRPHVLKRPLPIWREANEVGVDEQLRRRVQRKDS